MPAAAPRPNVILLMLDDMGFSDIGCFGAEIETPNLDRLGRGGMRFTHFYNGARCCPTRASLLTGLYAHQAGVGGMVGRGPTPAYQGFLNDSCVTIAEALRPAGYATLMSGKWHVGGPYANDRPETWQAAGDPGHPTPRQRGFDHYYGMLHGAGSYFNPPTLMREDALIEPGEDHYFTDAVGAEARRMVRGALDAGAPFFLYWTPTTPHWPLHAWPADIEKYRGRYREGWDVARDRRFARLRAEGLVRDEWNLSPRDEESHPWEACEHQEWEDLRMAVYAAQIDRLDQTVGEMIALLEERGVLDETLFIFLSDNGGCAEFLREDAEPGQWPEIYSRTNPDGTPCVVGNNPDREPGGKDTFMSYDLPWANVSNTPFRKFKSWIHEGGIATPFFVHWPAGGVEAGRITHEVTHIIDILPTILDAAGAAYPATRAGQDVQPPEGESFLPLLRGERWTRRTPLFWEHGGCRGMREGRWKLVAGRGGAPWELYDMAADRTELNDLAAAEPERTARMASAWQAWADRVGVRERG
jgi:arylsulfatase